MDLGLKGRGALVTGASRGIGAAIGAALAAEGCRVALAARGREDLAATVAEICAAGGDARGLVADLLSPGETERVVGEAIAALGELDILVHNLGGGRPEDTDEAWAFGLEMNLGVAVRACRVAVPPMVARRRGVVLLIASVSGTQVGGSSLSYTVSKAAEIMYARGLAKELAPHGVRVNAVSPGSILFPGGGWERRQASDPDRIGRFVAESLPLGRFGTPAEVASVVTFLASDRASLVTGANVAVDGAQLRPSVS